MINNKYFYYILGLIWADGHISKRCNSVSLYCKYENVVNSDFNTYMKIFDKIGEWHNYYYKRYDKRTNKHYHKGEFQKSDKHLHTFLKENEYSDKSYISPDKILNEIPKKRYNHFYRGYIDGDGSFYFNKSSTQFSAASTLDQDWSFMVNLFDELGVKYSIKRTSTKKGSYSQIRVTNNKDIVKLGDYLYENSEKCRLNRKYDIYISIKNSKLESRTHWTEEEINFLKENYESKGILFCAENLNKSKGAVYKKISRINITKK